MNRTPTTDTSFSSNAASPEYGQAGFPPLHTAGFMHPDQVVSDARLTHTEKREVLASWASDVRAVPNAPALRQLDNGAVIRLDDILRALNALDDTWSFKQPAFDPRQKRRHPRFRFPRRLGSAFRQPWTDDDDDDPPPCPALISRPPAGPLTGGEAAFSGLALAA
jgi:hypothetical protein